MKKFVFSVLALCLALPLAAAEYTTNDWAVAKAQWKAARVAWTNEMAKAAAAGLITPRKAGNPKRRQPGASTRQAAPVLSKSQAAYFNNRRICVKRDVETLPGYVITTWHRNGKLDTIAPAVITNQLKQIVGKEQHNPIQERAEAAEAEAKPLRDLKKAAKRTSKNYDKIMKDLEKAKKKASDADELAFYEQLGEIITEAFKAGGL